MFWGCWTTLGSSVDDVGLAPRFSYCERCREHLCVDFCVDSSGPWVYAEKWDCWPRGDCLTFGRADLGPRSALPALVSTCLRPSGWV